MRLGIVLVVVLLPSGQSLAGAQPPPATLAGGLSLQSRAARHGRLPFGSALSI